MTCPSQTSPARRSARRSSSCPSGTCRRSGSRTCVGTSAAVSGSARRTSPSPPRPAAGSSGSSSPSPSTSSGGPRPYGPTSQLDEKEANVAVAVMVDNPEGSQEIYEKVREQLGLGDAPAGGIFHAAGPSPNGGWRVIELWESEED